MNLLERVILWLPRVMAIAFAVYLALFATSVFLEGGSFAETTNAFVSHLLPAFCVVLLVIIGWRRDGLAAIGFAILAIAFFIALKAWSNPAALMIFTLPPVGICVAFLARMLLLAGTKKPE